MAEKNELLRDELVIAFGNILGHKLMPYHTFETTLDVVQDFNLHFLDVNMFFEVLDIEFEEIESPTIVVKKGTVIGSGAEVTPNEDGHFIVRKGDYNYSISKAGYETVSAAIEVKYIDADVCEKQVFITLHKLSEVSIVVTDSDNEAITGSTIILKKGSTIGSGDAVTPSEDGNYLCGIGTYNYSVAKDTYVTETGTFDIEEADLDKTKTFTIVLTVDAE